MVTLSDACNIQQYFTNENCAFFDKTRGYNIMIRKMQPIMESFRPGKSNFLADKFTTQYKRKITSILYLVYIFLTKKNYTTIEWLNWSVFENFLWMVLTQWMYVDGIGE
jgi:hypothetical protein